MPVIRIAHTHHRSRTEMRAQIESVANELQEKLHAQCHWDGDTAHFARRGASGSIKVDDDQVAIEITLGLALSPLKSQVEKTVNDRLDRILA